MTSTKLHTTRLPLFSLLFILLLLASLAFAAYDTAVPPVDGSVMKITFSDQDSHQPITGTLRVSIDYPAPNTARSTSYTVNISKSPAEVSISLPPASYSATAHLSASAQGYFDSTDTLTVTSEQFWTSVGGDTEFKTKPTAGGGHTQTDDVISDVPPTSSTHYLLEKTFEFKRNPNEPLPSVQSKAGAGSASCFGPALLVFGILVGSSLMVRFGKKLS